MASAPKGLLRHYVLKLLSEGPKSGSELMNEIEEKTEGRWKPSPGSVYPLLSWLLDSGYTEEASDQEAGVRRYILTDKGKEFLEEHEKRREEQSERFGPHFFGGPGLFGMESFPEDAKELATSLRRLRRVSWKLLKRISKDPSDELFKEVREILDEALAKMETLIEKSEA
ncbi:MAG: PadR family transcriptional regulator [Candidatus Thorarchaeota archaeon]|nr:MAG: PadR family transcriptional regulator [Candidatus Thorarchaeota archaeon]